MLPRTNLFAGVSLTKKMQERSALLVDFVLLRDSFSETFERLKLQNGKALTLLIENSFCDFGQCESIDEYYDSEIVTYLNVELLHDRESNDPLIPFIRDIREIFLDNKYNKSN